MSGMASVGDGEGRFVNNLAFTSDELPAHLDPNARFARWHEIFESVTCCSDYFRTEERPFQAHFRLARFGDAYVTTFGGTFRRIARTASAIARGPNDDFCILLNRGSEPFGTTQLGRDAAIQPGAVHLTTNGEAAEILAGTQCRINTITIGQERLRAFVPDATASLARPLDPGQPAVRHLARYVEGILELGATDSEPLQQHVNTTLLDLVALALGTGRDTVAVARGRGLRAARLQAILAGIQAGFAAPAFSPHVLALKLGLSARYIQDILHEAGMSFTERVLELRLQMARRLLASASGRRLRVSEIALSCGFNDVSYFNQAFRRRFGGPPTRFRG